MIEKTEESLDPGQNANTDPKEVAQESTDVKIPESDVATQEIAETEIEVVAEEEEMKEIAREKKILLSQRDNRLPKDVR